MTVEINPSTGEKVHEFNLREWPKASKQHYGQDVEYNDQEFVYAAEDKGEMIGVISGTHQSGVVTLHYMIVTEGRRKEGIGRNLMETAEQFARDMNAHKLHLQVGADWPAVDFYKALGFSEVARLPDHNFHREFLIMEKPIIYDAIDSERSSE